MGYQRATKAAQKGQSQTPSSSLRQTSLNHAVVHPLLELQRTIGNQAVLNLLRSQNTHIDASTQAFSEPRFGHDFSQIPIHPSQTVMPQMKLKVSQPGDVYEREADHVAEHVMRMANSEPPVSDDEDEIKNSLMRKQTGEPGANAATESHHVPSVVHDVLNTGGVQPLDTTTRAFMEPRFGHDFSAVRIHTDAQAAQSARAVNALAYTVGRDVVFGTGQYQPMTSNGRRLIAHELVHMVQQSGLDGHRVDETHAGCNLSPIGYERGMDKIANVITDAEKPDHSPKGPLSMQQFVRFGTLQRTPATQETSDEIKALEAEKTALEAIIKKGSGKTFGEVAGAFAKLKDVTHHLAILKTGRGTFVGSHCPIQPTGTEAIGCTNIVMIVLREAFKQQGRSAEWIKVDEKIQENTRSRGKKATLEGEDIQAALQSELGWKGIFWAPDPHYKVPTEELTGTHITKDEAEWAFTRAKKKGIYGDPGILVSIEDSVTNYAPEAPKAGHGKKSSITKDTTQLDKLKKIPFGVLSAHGATHMAFIIYGKVLEVHWKKGATDVNLFERTDLERWAVGAESGYHYYASGAIVAPAADVDAAFK